MAAKAAIYRIGPDLPEPTKARYGGKAFGLYQMLKAGIAVPPAFVIPTDTCRSYMVDPEVVMKFVREVALPIIRQGLIEDFGYMPLVSVRSGAPVSMPGMMDTILNVGLDNDTLPEWDARIGSDCLADCVNRLGHMYGNVVGANLPDSADEQIIGAIEAVFKSWGNDRARIYRELNGIPHDMGTAVVIQAMVFGNLNEQSGTGVAFSRDYSSGENKATGNFLPTEIKDGVLKRAQGEDVVAGAEGGYPLAKLEAWNPAVAAKLIEYLDKLEALERDMVDTEFTVQDGKLYMLQVRAGKRTAQAALKIAVDLFNEGVLSVEEALERVTLKQFLAAIRPGIPAAWVKANPAHGVGALDQDGCGASVGAVTGVAVFTNEDAVNCKSPCILIREETTPDDIAGLNAAVGALTVHGGATCHAAVVMRGMDKVCVVGCGSDKLYKSGGNWVLSDGKFKRLIQSGTLVTLDGATGSVWVNVEAPVEGGLGNEFVGKFLDMLSSKYDFYRTVTAKSELNGAKKVLLATYNLDRQFSGKELGLALIDLLEGCDGRDVVIDLRTFGQVCREADRPLEMLWGTVESDSDAISIKVQSLQSVGVELTSLGKALIKVLEFGLTAEQVAAVIAAGFSTVPVVSTLTELLDAKGLCVADFGALIKTAGKGEILRILDLKKAKGELVRSFNIAEQLDPADLGRNAVYALSALQAAQCLLSAGKGD